MHILFPMGQDSSNLMAGFLRVRTPTVSPRSARVEKIGSLVRPSVWTAQFVDGAGRPSRRQWHTGNILADAEQTIRGTTDADTFEMMIRFYHAADVVGNGTDPYTPTAQAQPFTTTTITYNAASILSPRNLAQTVPGARLRVVTTGAGAGVWEITNAGADFVMGSAVPTSGTAPRREVMLVDANAPVAGQRTVTRTIVEPDGTTVVRTVEVYDALVRGNVVAQRIGPVGQEQTETRTYYPDGRLQHVVDANGHWQHFEYVASGNTVGNLAKVVSQFKNGSYNPANPSASEAANRVTTYTTHSLTLTRPGVSDGVPDLVYETTEFLQGHAVARNFTIVWSDGQFTTEVWSFRAATADAPANLATFLNAIAASPMNSAHRVSISVRESVEPYRTLYSVGDDAVRTVYTRTVDSQTGNKTVSTVREKLKNDMSSSTPPRLLGKSVTVTTARGVTIDQAGYEYLPSGVEVQVSRSWSDPATEVDPFGRVLVRHHLDGTSETYDYDCCNLESETDRSGITSTYQYDALRRRTSQTRPLAADQSLQMSFTYDAADRTLTSTRTGTGIIPTTGQNTVISNLQSETAYDPYGRVSWTKDARLAVTDYAYSVDQNGLLVETTTMPDPDDTGPLPRSTIVRKSYPDGQVESVSGTGAHPVKYEYGIEQVVAFPGQPAQRLRFTKETRGLGTSAWVKSYIDALGRPVCTKYPDGAASYTWYSQGADRLDQGTQDPDGVVTLSYAGYGLDDVPSGWPTSGVSWTGRWNVVVQDYFSLPTPQPSDGVRYAPDFGGKDRIVQSHSVLAAADSNKPLRRQSSTTSWTMNGSATTVYVESLQESAIGNLGAAPGGAGIYLDRSWSTRDGKTTYRETVFNAATKLTTTTTTVPSGVRTEELQPYGRPAQASRNAPGPSSALLSRTMSLYDVVGRVIQSRLVTNPANPATDAVTDFLYASGDDSLAAQTDPDPDGVAPSTDRRVTLFDYDRLGRVVAVHSPGGTATTKYDALGQVVEVSGFGVTPTRHVYDDQGRLRQLKTYQQWNSGTNPTGEAVTTWNYSNSRGWLDGKQYHDQTGPSYTYTPAGRLLSRAWAREQPSGQQLVTSYGYSCFGELTSTDYSDSTTDTSMNFDRRGRVIEVRDDAGFRVFTYDDAGRLLNEQIQADGGGLDALVGAQWTHGYDGTGRRNSLLVEGAEGWVSSEIEYDYDAQWRLHEVEKGGLRVDYSYHEPTGQVETVQYFESSSNTEMARAKREYDRLGRLTDLRWTTYDPNESQLKRYAYRYDTNGRRDRLTEQSLEVNTYWDYAYDTLGQLNTARRFFTAEQGQLAVPGSQYKYVHDTIGNRTETWDGGDHDPDHFTAAHMNVAGYTPNLLNQYDQRDVPGAVPIVGERRLSSSAVYVGGCTDQSNCPPSQMDAAWLKDFMFHHQLSFDNAFWPVVAKVYTSEIPGDINGRRDVFLPLTPEVFDYDADGNLTRDGVWYYEWDAENRLKAMYMRPPVAQVVLGLGDSWLRLEFAYDHMGRRISKRYRKSGDDPGEISDKHGAEIAWSATESDRRFLHDGWMPVMAYKVDQYGEFLGADQSWAWGPDLSGTLGGAGGIGGLAVYTDDSVPPDSGQYHGPMFPVFDGQGNVTRICELDGDGASDVVASYEYGPFGECRSITGVQGQRNPMRWSSKFTDAETGLVYYGYRYYSVNSGRWLNRDPSEEVDYPNLTCFVNNRPSESVDPFGLWERVHDWNYVGNNGFRGHAVAECGDTYEELARLITNNESDASALAFWMGVTPSPGEIVDIAPLLQLLDERLRRGTAAYAGNLASRSTLNGGVIGFSSPRPRPAGEAGIREYWTRVTPGITSDCSSAAWLSMLRSLIDHLSPNEFDSLFDYNELGLKHFREVPIELTRQGDHVMFANHALYSAAAKFDPTEREDGSIIYSAAFQFESTIRVSEDGTGTPYFAGFPIGTLSEQGWLEELANATNQRLANARVNDPKKNPRWNQSVSADEIRATRGYQPSRTYFLDIPTVAARTFDHRRSAAGSVP